MRLQRRLIARLKIYLVNCPILPFAAALWQPLILFAVTAIYRKSLKHDITVRIAQYYFKIETHGRDTRTRREYMYTLPLYYRQG